MTLEKRIEKRMRDIQADMDRCGCWGYSMCAVCAMKNHGVHELANTLIAHREEEKVCGAKATGHYIKTCHVCGTVISQCRCMDCHKTKLVGICADCYSKNSTPCAVSAGQDALTESQKDIPPHISKALDEGDNFMDLVGDDKPCHTCYHDTHNDAENKPCGTSADEEIREDLIDCIDKKGKYAEGDKSMTLQEENEIIDDQSPSDGVAFKADFEKRMNAFIKSQKDIPPNIRKALDDWKNFMDLVGDCGKD